MKKWVKYFLVTVLLLAALSPLEALAKNTGEARLDADGNSAVLSLTVEDKIADTMTSLRLGIFIEVEEGTIVLPAAGAESSFVFDSGIDSQVKDWKVKKEGGEYIIDIIISGTVNLFKGSGSGGKKTLTIGTLTLAPGKNGSEKSDFRAEVGFATDVAESGTAVTPIAEFVEKGAFSAEKIDLMNAESVILPEEEKEPETPSQPETPAEPETPTESETPSQPGPEDPSQPEAGGPNQPDTEDSGNNPTPSDPENFPSVDPPSVVPTPETVPFDPSSPPAMELGQTLKGSSCVEFSWTAVPGASGYEIYRVRDDGTEKLIATVYGTEYGKELGYNKNYQFRIRAFRLEADGKTKTYGEFGDVISIRTPVKSLGKPNLTAEAAGGSKKVSLLWKKVKGADGYIVYQKDGETGRFEAVKTINGAGVTFYTAKKNRAETYTFRVAAFRYGEDGEIAVFGNYSREAAVTVPPAKPKKVTAKSEKKGKVTLTWKKAQGAQGYQIFVATSENGAYTRVKTTSKPSWKGKAKSGTTCYYKVKAFAKDEQGKKVFGSYSAVKKVTVK